MRIWISIWYQNEIRAKKLQKTFKKRKTQQPTENQENTEHRNINQMVASSYIYHSKAGGSHPFILVSFVNVADLC